MVVDWNGGAKIDVSRSRTGGKKRSGKHSISVPKHQKKAVLSFRGVFSHPVFGSSSFRSIDFGGFGSVYLPLLFPVDTPVRHFLTKEVERVSINPLINVLDHSFDTRPFRVYDCGVKQTVDKSVS